MKGNILGDIRAENDTKMLESAYYESSDYKALVESYDRPIVVGRRGTGKSALAFKLQKHWKLNLELLLFLSLLMRSK